MDKEKTVNGPAMRITRSRAKAIGLPPLHPSAKGNEKQVPKVNSKRSAPNEIIDSLPHKKRAVLKDVTNSTSISSINSVKIQPGKVEKKGLVRKSVKLVSTVNGKKALVKKDIIVQKDKVFQGICSSVEFEENKAIQFAKCILLTGSHQANHKPIIHKEVTKHWKKEEEGSSDSVGIEDIDTKYKDPQMCSLYAPDIYRNLQTMELQRRPSGDYMEKMQQDITQGMRRILIDWLVEVSEEYRLVPDTLYLTIHLIDRFLSDKQIEKQKLQLVGVTCMLIASKYEEICAPRVEEFCFITDNTYTKEEVVKMESQVLNVLGFRFSDPTTKKFLRRFIQAAQVSYKVPSVELEFLANYLAELTLLEYSFLKFLPSLIAASAVFLAKWTLDQSDHPWNRTLEHYTSYKTSDLKPVVLALQELQRNTNGCTLLAIREKYRQTKFKTVASLSPIKPVETLF